MPEPLARGDRFVPAPAVRSRALDDELVLLDLDAGTYYSLNRTGALVWAALERGEDLGQVDQALTAWPVDDDTRWEMLTSVVRNLVDQGLLHLASG